MISLDCMYQDFKVIPAVKDQTSHNNEGGYKDEPTNYL